MNPREDAPKNPLDDINPEDDVELQKIEALEARTVDPNPGPLRVPTRHRDQPVPQRIVTPEPIPVEKPIEAPVVPAPVITKPVKVATPVAEAPKPVAKPAPKVELKSEPKPAPKPEPKAAPLTTSDKMNNELAKAPPLNVAQTIRQFFGKQNASHPSAIIIVIILVVVIAVGGYFAWQYLQA